MKLEFDNISINRPILGVWAAIGIAGVLAWLTGTPWWAAWIASTLLMLLSFGSYMAGRHDMHESAETFAHSVDHILTERIVELNALKYELENQQHAAVDTNQ